MSDFIVENNILMKPLSEIKPYERNPRRNDKTVELLCEIIPKVGFNVPIVIDKDGVIVKGHARYLAAKKLGMSNVPCIVSHASAEAIKADRIADNKVSEFSEWVNESLNHEIDMLDLSIDLSSMGLERMNYDDIPDMDDYQEDKSNSEISEEEKRQLYIRFLEQKAKENAVDVQMTSESAIKQAIDKQANVPREARNYGLCVCEKCGNIMYYDKNVLYGRNGTIRRR